MLASEGCPTQYERWSLGRLPAWRWYAVALPAALIAALAGIGALTADPRPDRGSVAVAMAGVVMTPYAALIWLEARRARRSERLRDGQLRMMRLEREWLAMSDWEMADRVAWLLSAGGVHVDWIPTPLEADRGAFAAIGRHPHGGRLVAYAARACLDEVQMERAIGRAVLEGAQTIVFVAPAGADEQARARIARGAPGMRIELWQIDDLLTKAEALSQPA